MDFKAIGARIKAARIRANYTQTDLAEMVRSTQPGIARMESGAQGVTLAKLVKLADVLGQPVTYFLNFETDLTDDEQEMLAAYRRLSDQEKDNILNIADVLRKGQQNGRRRYRAATLTVPVPKPVIEHIPSIRPDIPPETVAKIRAMMERLTPTERARLIDHLLARRDFVEALKLRGIEIPPQHRQQTQTASNRKDQE